MYATLLKRFSTLTALALLLTSCNSEMVTTSNFYDVNAADSSNVSAKQKSDHYQERHAGDVTSKSRPADQGDAPDVDVRAVMGIPYFLPQSVVHFTITGSYPKPKDSSSDKTSTAGDAQKKREDANAAQKASDASPDNKPLKDKATAANALADAAEAKAVTEKSAAYSIVVKYAVERQADPNQRYLLEMHPEDGTDDDLAIGVNEKGLLATVSATSTDESGEILKTLAKIAATVATQGNTFALALNTLPICTDLQEFTLDWYQPITSDMLNPDAPPVDTTPLKKAIFEQATGHTPADNEKGPDIAMEVKEVPTKVTKLPHDQWPPVDNPRRWAPGIRFRLPTIGNLSISLNTSTFKELNPGTKKMCTMPTVVMSVQNEQHLLLDPSKDFVFQMKRTPLVKTSIKLTISDGLLTSAEVSKPSPALAAVTLPLDLINILLGPITTLIHGPAEAAPGTSTTKAGGS